MSVTYDENVIVTFAARLYRRAASIVFIYSSLGGLAGVLVTLGVAGAYQIHSEATSGVAFVLALIGIAFGWIIGSERAFALRLLAQQALCQVQIERNTRAAAPAATGS